MSPLDPEHMAKIGRKGGLASAAKRKLNPRPPVMASVECARGHVWRPETTYINPKGSRVCTICARENRRRWEAKHK